MNNRSCFNVVRAANVASSNVGFSGSGAAALAHLDGSGTEDAAAAMIQRVTELALGYPEGRLELQLVGGYSDPRNYSEELFYNILCTWKYISDAFLLSMTRRVLFFMCKSTEIIIPTLSPHSCFY